MVLDNDFYVDRYYLKLMWWLSILSNNEKYYPNGVSIKMYNLDLIVSDNL